jgi:hypothetical protein
MEPITLLLFIFLIFLFSQIPQITHFECNNLPQNRLQGRYKSTTLKRVEPIFHHLNTITKCEMGKVLSTEIRVQKAL